MFSFYSVWFSLILGIDLGKKTYFLGFLLLFSSEVMFVFLMLFRKVIITNLSRKKRTATVFSDEWQPPRES